MILFPEGEVEMKRKNTLKMLLGTMLALSLVLALSVSSIAATKYTKVTKSYQTYKYTRDADPTKGIGTMSISKAKIVDNSKTKAIYFVALHGVETEDQVDNWDSCLKAAGGESSAYLKQAKKTIRANVPKNANIVLAGHSLGGMVAQQLRADKTMKKEYNILYTVTFGSPLINVSGKPEGKLNRLAAKGDPVPLLSDYTLNDIETQFKDLQVEDHIIPVIGVPILAHITGYYDEKAWADYDAVGQKGGNVVLKVDDSTTTYFYLPA